MIASLSLTTCYYYHGNWNVTDIENSIVWEQFV